MIRVPGVFDVDFDGGLGARRGQSLEDDSAHLHLVPPLLLCHEFASDGGDLESVPVERVRQDRAPFSFVHFQPLIFQRIFYASLHRTLQRGNHEGFDLAGTLTVLAPQFENLYRNKIDLLEPPSHIEGYFLGFASFSHS